MDRQEVFVKVAYDIKLMQPACVLVAAGMGASTDASKRFPSELWLLTPTPGMRVYETTPEQLESLISKTIDHHQGKVA